MLLNLQRTPTFKRIQTILVERKTQLELDIGQVGLTDADRAMLHGRLTELVRLTLHLATEVVERELADRSPSPEADAPASLPDPVRKPELF